MNNPEEFYKKLRSQLADTALWPSAYLYKFIVPTDNSKIFQIETIFDNLGAVISKKQSMNGKYTSVSINAWISINVSGQCVTKLPNFVIIGTALGIR